MKTVTKQEALRGFERLGGLVHAGETVVVTQSGKPWIKLVSAEAQARGKSAADFKSRLDLISRKPLPGVSDVLKRLRR